MAFVLHSHPPLRPGELTSIPVPSRSDARIILENIHEFETVIRKALKEGHLSRCDGCHTWSMRTEPCTCAAKEQPPVVSFVHNTRIREFNDPDSSHGYKQYVSIEASTIKVGNWEVILKPSHGTPISLIAATWLSQMYEFRLWLMKQCGIETFTIDTSAMTESERETFVQLAAKYHKTV